MGGKDGLVDPKKDFLKAFGRLSYRHSAWEVWNDFVVMAACALSNPVDKMHYKEREDRYLSIIRKYKKDEQEVFSELFALTVMALEKNQEQDFLGQLYMELKLNSKEKKQEFTPYGLCQAMAEITMADTVREVHECGYITLNDCCCGGGAILIAGVNTAKRLLGEEGLNFQNHVLVSAQDIDETVALMCYIQLSLLGVAAYIKVGNSITEPMTDSDTLENYWFTPMYFSDVWAMRRIVHGMDKLFQSDEGEKK